MRTYSLMMTAAALIGCAASSLLAARSGRGMPCKSTQARTSQSTPLQCHFLQAAKVSQALHNRYEFLVYASVLISDYRPGLACMSCSSLCQHYANGTHSAIWYNDRASGQATCAFKLSIIWSNASPDIRPLCLPAHCMPQHLTLLLTQSLACVQCNSAKIVTAALRFRVSPCMPADMRDAALGKKGQNTSVRA